jgi:hypothetical protein
MKPPVVTKEVLRLKLMLKPDGEFRCILRYLQERSEYAVSETNNWPRLQLMETILATDYPDAD